MHSLISLLSFKYTVFIFKPGFLSVIPLHYLGVNLWLDRVYLEHLKPLRLPPLPMDICVGKGSSFEFSLFSSLPQVYLSIGSFQVSWCMNAILGSIKSMWIPWAFPDLSCAYVQAQSRMFASNITVSPCYWAGAIGHWPFLVLLKMMPLGITHHSENWALFKLRSFSPASCWQNLHASQAGSLWGGKWGVPSQNAIDSHFSYLKFNSIIPESFIQLASG